MRRVWILDTDESSADELVNALSTLAYDIDVWTVPGDMLRALGDGVPDVVVLEHGIEGADAVDVLREVKGAGGRVPVVVVARRTSSQGAIESMREGAYDYLPRETLPSGLEDAVRRALSSDGGMIRTVGSPGPGDVADLGAIIGRTPEMVEIHKLIGQVAATDASVLIHGESGTGKELIARAIHYNSGRRERPFVAVNCAALPGDPLETELFGGRAAGGQEVPGRFELARDGTIFLDEISESSLSVQGRILTVMEDGFYERPGTRAKSKIDVRVIAATGQSLVNRMKEDQFRVDLFYRLKVISIYIPPLRERRDDVQVLAEHFLERTRTKMQKQISGMTPAALEMLQSYVWPGNVRELEQAIQHAVTLNRTGVLSPEDFEISGDAEVQALGHAVSEGEMARCVRTRLRNRSEAGEEGISDGIVSEVEAVLAHEALEMSGGNQVKAAKLLGISRNTLRKRLSGEGIVMVRVALIFASLLFALTGCSHYSFSSAVKTHISTIAVPVLVNETLEYGAEQGVTDALITEFTDDNALRVVGEDEADSILRGAVVLYERPVISYDASGDPREYKVRVVAKLSYEDLTRNEVVWEGDVEGWAVYSEGGEGGDLTTEEEAQEYVYEKLAQDVLSKTVQGW